MTPAGGIVLRLGTSRYAVPMSDVAEVVPVPLVTRIPGTPGWLWGVANWRGRILPVVDVRPLLRTPTTPLGSSARLVVLEEPGGGLTAGLVAESVHGVYDGSLADLTPPPSTLPAEASALVVGQVGDGTGPVAVLDAGAVLALRGAVDRARINS